MRRCLAFRHLTGADCGSSGAVHSCRTSSSLQTLVAFSGTLCFSCSKTFTTSSSATISSARCVSCVAVCTPARHFGNAPSRIRPAETPAENMWRQSERETSASVVIVIMFMVPLWLYVLSAHGQEQKRAAVRAWALEQREQHHPSEREGEDKT
ncbi:hypothetical protein conserved [Leishmania donovani]|uniref:Uncharacterized protein n=4 Tax=Leishmania donovani species complex TaxID=38574 RepID=A4I061_LEIIN|nr:conserved hypothetical protein [Leishmania infantum JPCM5]XP_003860926.1 hypothetical protein, conserved [Leishmania donovani]CAC9489032.1 hypothetical_protein_-_conserved [Leishmania infantum]AYU78896.1 hypothetical protein LdCL_230007400 [Leishmania donovani]AYU78901.1 hypothetical protein LdCL_230007900 [Leishmania donovani]CAJ1988895.1 hypothetical protein conserved [Leishmania donovani]CAM68128.1 conserved hypothetical protein [Leishmania infantum JPCM5]|eukprot:XP_001465702.1 conserved hypothetical protein [Leishmania infantum JPCM5]